MTIWEHIKNFFAPPITSRIITGAFYIKAVEDMNSSKLLIMPPFDLSPAHVNCARIVFAYSGDTINSIQQTAADNGCQVLLDSVLLYGLEGHNI